MFLLINSNAQLVTTNINISNNVCIITNSSTNFSTSNSFKIGKENTNIYTSILYFNLNDTQNNPIIPINAIITSAKLILKPASSDVTATNLYKVELIENKNSVNNLSNLSTLNWTNINPLTYSTFNTNFTTLSTNSQLTSNFINGFREFELKSMIQEFVSKQRFNFGISIKAINESINLIPIGNYYSKESSNPANRPILVIKYYLPLTINSCVVNHATSLTSTDASIALSIQNLSNYPTNSVKWTNSSGVVVGSSLNLTGIQYGIYNCEITFPSQPELNFYYSFLVGVKCQDINLDFISTKNNTEDLIISMYQPFQTNSLSNSLYTSKGLDKGAAKNLVRSLMKFKLWIDPNILLNKADLNLKGFSHVYSPTTNESVFQLLNSPWTNSNTSWYNQLNCQINPIVAPINHTITTSITENRTINMLPFFNYWKNSNLQNNGFLFKLSNENFLTEIQNYMRFYSTDNTDQNLIPKVNFNITVVGNCSISSINDLPYIDLKYKYDGSFGRTFNGILKISFFEDYATNTSNSGDIIFMDFKILTDENTTIASCNSTGTILTGFSTNTNFKIKEGDNKKVINLSSLGLIQNKFYFLEMKDLRGEIRKIKFLYIN